MLLGEVLGGEVVELVLAADPDRLEALTPDKLVPSTNAVPERFEFGTLPYEIMAGATAAAEFVETLTHEAIEAHETPLLRRLEDGLAALERAAARSDAAEPLEVLRQFGGYEIAAMAGAVVGAAARRTPVSRPVRVG